MWIIDGIFTGLIAGIIMGCISQLGFSLHILRSHLIVIDGKFTLQKFNIKQSNFAIYFVGTIIHLFTSIIFGIIYAIIIKLVDFTINATIVIALYVLVLWLAMLLIALPIAGQGFLGIKIHRFAWLEQLILHIFFGIGFWWASGIF